MSIEDPRMYNAFSLMKIFQKIESVSVSI